jgi:type IV pilus assembly protein PilB
LDPETIFYHKGCPNCNHTGYRGRTTVSECFITSPELEELIAENAPNHKLLECLKKDDIHTLMKDGLEKTIFGITDLNELERVI